MQLLSFHKILNSNMDEYDLNEDYCENVHLFIYLFI